MHQTWFEMRDVRRRRLATSVWIPLRAAHIVQKEGRYGYAGFKEEFFGLGSLAVAVEKKQFARELGWMDVGIAYDHGPLVEGERYLPSDIYEDSAGQFTGVHLVLAQRANRLEVKEWHLHQDLVIALGLKREADVWVSPDEGYIEAARLRRGDDATPCLLEVRADHLRDYLCARRIALCVCSYRSRHVIVDNANHINWSENPFCEGDDGDRWEGQVLEIHEGGHPFGATIAVHHASRTDVDVGEDVPHPGFPTDDDVVSESWTMRPQGRKLYRIQGELWRTEWIDPAPHSPRVRGDEAPATVFFTTDAEGTREGRETLQSESRWLWFRPDVIMALAHRRGGALTWYTAQTGAVTSSPDYGVHFGVNRLGLVNVYAKDIALLPEWQQTIWSGFNVSPEGGVSEELLASQMWAMPAETQAPEEFLPTELDLLNRLGREKLGFPLFREHEQIQELLVRSHRFRAVDKAGLFSLAKDLARLTADSLDAAAMQTVVIPPKGIRWGSLRSLEALIATKIGPDKARLLVGPLVGIYELRNADAHLPSTQAEHALSLVGVDESLPPVFQAYQLLDACVSSLYRIAGVLQQWDANGLDGQGAGQTHGAEQH